VGAAGWTAIADALDGITSLTSLNGYDRCHAVRMGGVAELHLTGTELGVAVARFLPRSADTLTLLELRCLTAPPASQPAAPSLRRLRLH
jgi:hypothetical protein